MCFIDNLNLCAFFPVHLRQRWRSILATKHSLGGMMKKLLLAASLATLTTTAFADVTLIRAGRVITDASKPALGASTIVVRDGRIVAIEAGLTATAADLKPGEKVTEINLGNKTVLPGLIDSHVHLSGDPGTPFWREAIDTDEYATVVGVKNAGITVRAGFTTVRDLGSAPFVGFALRDGTAKGLFSGPRIVSAGPAISITGGHGDVSGFRENVLQAMALKNTCSGADACAERVRELARSGADVIKITATGGVLSQQARGLDKHFTDPELKAIMDTAHTLGLKVAAHAHGPRGMEAAATAGVDSIEHGTFGDDAALRAMKAKNVYMVPTLMAFTGLKDRIGKNVYTPQVEAKAKAAMAQLGKALNAAKKMGVPIAFGTDSGVFEHGRNAEELGMMVELGGLTPREAIASATTTAAKLLGLEAETGSLEPGKSADIIAVEGDPLTDVRKLEKVAFVMVRGTIAKAE
jgi:imidazolonepropionase-like amidohydrolase